MKYLILLLAFSFTSSASNAQDTSCQKLINLQKMQKMNFSRMTSKHSFMGGMLVIERDKLSNYYTCSTASALGRQLKSEYIFFNNKSYSRKNDEQWCLEKNQRVIDTSMFNLTEQQKQNRLPYNCQQLNDEVLNGERCFVFSYEKNRLTAKKTSNFSKYIQKEWYNEQGLLKKIEMKINSTHYTVTTLEYDIDILIKEPKITKK